MLFQKRIDSWPAWAKARADAGAFVPLLSYIYRKDGLPFAQPVPLPLGTGALFRVGDTVIKLYATAATGHLPEREVQAEAPALKAAHAGGWPAPKLLHYGAVRDEAHLFYYIIMPFVEGEMAGSVLPKLDRARQLQTAKQLGKLVGALHALTPPAALSPEAAYERVFASPSWARFPQRFRWQASERAYALRSHPQVFAHGDLNGQNLLFTPKGKLKVVDFAEAAIAPKVYEWPPILLGLFAGDPGLAMAFTGEEDLGRIADGLLDGIALHPYGASYARDLLRAIGAIPEEADGFSMLYQALTRGWDRRAGERAIAY